MTTVIITMSTGDKHSLSGYESQIAEQVNAARGSGKLVALERDRIPTGQMIYVDPDEVVSVKGER